MQKTFHHYALTQLLDQQKFKSTYLAYPQGDVKLKVLVKIFDKECIGSNPDHAKSLLETKSFLSLDHPHIVPVLNMGVVNRQPYIVTQYMSYGSLRHKLDDWSLRLMDWTEAVNIVMQIGQALIYAHERDIIHSNIKPNNILFDAEGKVLLTDFRPSYLIDSSKLDYKADRQTTAYMAPEQFIGKSTHYSDQYSLACLAYELIAGHGPFGATQNFSLMWNKHATEKPLPLTELIPALPIAIEEALLKALAKVPEMRYPDIEAFIHDIESGIAPSTTNKVTFATKSEREIDPLTATFPHKVRLSAITGPLPILVMPDVASEELLIPNVAPDLVLKKKSDPDKVAMKSPVIATSSSKKQQPRRSNKFVLWPFALASIVILSLGSLIYAVSGNTQQTAIKNGGTLHVMHTMQATADVFATTVPKATVRPIATPTTVVATSTTVAIGSSDGSGNTSTIPTIANIFTPVPTVNLALGAFLHASSSYERYGWGMKYVNDGKTTSTSSSMGWSSNGNYNHNHTEWVTLDLGSTASISRVELYPRGDLANVGQGFPGAFIISLSTDGTNWINVVSQSNYPLPNSGAAQAFFFPTQSARYVLVQGTTLRPIPNEFNRYRMQFAEITIY